MLTKTIQSKRILLGRRALIVVSGNRLSEAYSEAAGCCASLPDVLEGECAVLCTTLPALQSIAGLGEATKVDFFPSGNVKDEENERAMLTLLSHEGVEPVRAQGSERQHKRHERPDGELFLHLYECLQEGGFSLGVELKGDLQEMARVAK